MLFSPASSSSPRVQASSSRVPVYSFTWAAAIFQKAYQTRPRVWEILLDLLGISERQMAFLIACNDPSWPWIRTLSHTLDKWRARQAYLRSEELPITEQMLSGLLSVHRCTCPESLLAYLTDRISRLIIEEQVKRGEGEASRADPSDLFRTEEGRIDYFGNA